ncbi:Zn-dependent protease with chaperone function [Acinetobacter boissieri]|uniref:Zn-dependent protease with chaperone function n=2 Tax=Acinetobacter boissieri TaxID=1219383 RepID=A0A1G6GTY5_9GAMM|nr:peptidase M48 [Acinetobacter boissieri]SDB85424.1 Zn-dependent protease with chaperone function [Acinetobacter boissieri]
MHKKNLFIATVICLFAIVLTLAILNFSFGFIVYYLDQTQSIWWNRYSQTFLICVMAIMVTSLMYEIYIFRKGGHSLARQMNARYLDISECTPEELIAVQITESLAEQFNIVVPSVYILPDEVGVNALTAGADDTDTVIILTWGALQNLDELELHGLLSYTFNQIITGEAQQNIRLKILFSALITFNQLGSEIARRGFRSDISDEKEQRHKFETVLIAVGGMIWLMGSLGLLISRLVKYFTLSGRTFKNDLQTQVLLHSDTNLQTLLRIYVHHAGSQIHSSYSESIAHMCFANSLSPQSWLNTHPSIKSRIYCLSPHLIKELQQEKLKKLTHLTSFKLFRPFEYEEFGATHILWSAPKPLPSLRFAHALDFEHEQVYALNPIARKTIEKPQVVIRALQTATGVREVLVAILMIRQYKAFIPQTAAVSHAIIEALENIDHRLHIQIFLDACEQLKPMPLSMARKFLTRLASITQSDGYIGLLDILLLEKVKAKLNLLPVHMPTSSDSISTELTVLVDALLHVQHLGKESQKKRRIEILLQLVGEDILIDQTKVDLGLILHHMSGLLLRDRLKFLYIAEQCLWNDRVITQEELDVLKLLYWRFGFESSVMVDRVLNHNNMMIM